MGRAGSLKWRKAPFYPSKRKTPTQDFKQRINKVRNKKINSGIFPRQPRKAGGSRARGEPLSAPGTTTLQTMRALDPPAPSSPSLLAGRTRCCQKLEAIPSDSSTLSCHHLWLFGCSASPFPPFWEFTCPKRYLSTWTRPLSLLKKTKTIPSLLFITLLGNAAPQTTFNNSSQQPVNPEEICECFKAL